MREKIRETQGKRQRGRGKDGAETEEGSVRIIITEAPFHAHAPQGTGAEGITAPVPFRVLALKGDLCQPLPAETHTITEEIKKGTITLNFLSRKQMRNPG